MERRNTHLKKNRIFMREKIPIHTVDKIKSRWIKLSVIGKGIISGQDDDNDTTNRWHDEGSLLAAMTSFC